MVETRTPRYALPQWGDADTDAPSMEDFNEGFLALDAAPIDLQGTLATRPGPGVPGRYHWATDAGLLARDDGTAWRAVGASPSDASPVVTSSTASTPGVALPYAREDHRHGFTSGTPTVSAPGDAAAQGTAAALARSDHRHGREAAIVVPTASNAIPFMISSEAGGAGSAAEYSRADHRHQVTYGTPSALTVGGAAAAGTQYMLARSDHLHALPAFGSVGPISYPGAVRDNGSATTFARADHQHGRESYGGAPTTSNPGDSGAAGSSTAVSRADHRHSREAANSQVYNLASNSKTNADAPGTYSDGLSIMQYTGAAGNQGWPDDHGRVITIRDHFQDVTDQYFSSGDAMWTRRSGDAESWMSAWSRVAYTVDIPTQFVAIVPDGKLAAESITTYPTPEAPQNGVFFSTCVTANGWPVQGTVHTVKRADAYAFQDVVERLTTTTGSPRRYYRSTTSTSTWSSFVQV
jgi:hypothetical protein